jgi:hypothetical protein
MFLVVSTMAPGVPGPRRRKTPFFGPDGSVILSLILCVWGGLSIASSAAASEMPPAVLIAPPAPWGPGVAYTGFQRFPALYFGGNEAGPQSPAQLDFVGRFALAGWGWQQGFSAGRHGESQGAAAAAALRARHPRCANCTSSPDATFVYRQSESLFTYYDLMAAVAANSTLDAAAQLRDPASGKLCGGGGLLAFGNATFATGYWGAGPVAEEVSNETAVDAVFFDGYDKLYAPGALSAEGCPGFAAGANLTGAELLHKVAATTDFLATLAASGRAAIVSTYNFLASTASPSSPRASPPSSSSSSSAAIGAMDGVTEDAYVAAWAGRGAWLRFYEEWMGHGAAQDAALVANAIAEGALGVPFVARTQVGSVHTLEYPAAAFLVAQGPFCYWGASSGWTDADWAWHGEYDYAVGAPLGPAIRTGAYSWTRAFAKANVSVDTEKGLGAVSMAA